MEAHRVGYPSDENRPTVLIPNDRACEEQPRSQKLTWVEHWSVGDSVCALDRTDLSIDEN
jgi:hypothetical protein